jgi:hypothetical protein
MGILAHVLLDFQPLPNRVPDNGAFILEPMQDTAKTPLLAIEAGTKGRKANVLLSIKR